MMSIDPLSDAKIVDSWRKNDAPRTNAVRESQIESRMLETWVKLFSESGFRVDEVREPLHPKDAEARLRPFHRRGVWLANVRGTILLPAPRRPVRQWDS